VFWCGDIGAKQQDGEEYATAASRCDVGVNDAVRDGFHVI
jgi:hypothetical protein